MLDIERELRLLAEHKIDFVVIGGIAARAHGSFRETFDLDVCYARDRENLNRLAAFLGSVHAALRGAPRDIPFRLDAETLHRGLNFTFETDIGALDLLGEVRGIGGYGECLENCVSIEMFGYVFKVLALEKLIIAKRTAGRPKDLMMLPELEAILEYQEIHKAAGEEGTDDDSKSDTKSY
jgi:predicted nucleotidyltransferase